VHPRSPGWRSVGTVRSPLRIRRRRDVSGPLSPDGSVARRGRFTSGSEAMALCKTSCPATRIPLPTYVLIMFRMSEAHPVRHQRACKTCSRAAPVGGEQTRTCVSSTLHLASRLPNPEPWTLVHPASTIIHSQNLLPGDDKRPDKPAERRKLSPGESVGSSSTHYHAALLKIFIARACDQWAERDDRTRT